MALPHAAGILFVAGDRVLLLKRSAAASVGANTWGLPAGSIEPGETPERAARRETHEEVGHAYTGPLKRLWQTRDGFVVYGAGLARPFAVQLNHEHTEFQWARFDALPAPLFPNFGRELVAMAADVRPGGDSARLALDLILSAAAHCLRSS